MKPTTHARLASAALVCIVLAGCGSDGETARSAGVDTDSGASDRSVVEFIEPSASVSEADGTATVTVARSGGSGAVTVTVTTRDGTANQPQDYTAISTTLTFAAGDTSPKTAAIEIANDATDESDETFYVLLTVASSGGAPGSTSEMLVTIADDEPSGPAALTAAMSAAYKHLHIDWTGGTNATIFRLKKDPTGSDGFIQVGTDLPASATFVDFEVDLLREDWLNARYVIEACNDAGCTLSNVMSMTGMSIPLIGYLKARNPGDFDQFGYSVSISEDGNTLAVAAPHENSSGRGLNGTPVDDCDSPKPANCAFDSGAVYVYTRSGNEWTGPVYIKASNTQPGQLFGFSVAVSANGNMLAVGAPGEGSAATGIGDSGSYNCDVVPTSNCARSSGAVYVYTRSASDWSGPVYVKASNTEAGQLFGFSVSASRDGNTLAVGAPGEGSASRGIGGNANYSCDIQSDIFNCAFSSGAVYVYTRSDSVWSDEPVYVKASNTGFFQQFGASVGLSPNGSTLAVGAPGESSAATGISGDQSYHCALSPNDPPSFNCASSAGAVYVYTQSDFTWSGAPLYVKASNTRPYQEFGSSVALDQNGNTLAVGAPGEDSAANGVGGKQADDCDADSPANCAFDSGALYVYSRAASTWLRDPVYVKASNTGPGDRFGVSVALNKDGSVIAVGAPGESGGTAGLASAADGSSNDELPGAGAVYLYTRDESPWTPTQYVKASNPDVDDAFGGSLALSGDASTLAVGAAGEDSSSAGFNNNQFDNDCDTSQDADCATSSGAVYVY